jgi:Arc/MetJ-type ribon-helix-helix transcriptional regulator
MNINLGVPYEAAIKRIIEKGYAGNQTEVIRQALTAYERMLEEEEMILVHKACEYEMRDFLAGNVKGKTIEELEEKYNI